MKRISKDEFVWALSRTDKPSPAMMRLIAAHHSASGRALTATGLAHEAGYDTFRPVNLQYGGLARRIAELLGKQRQGEDDWLAFLVDFIKPAGVTNEHWVLVMRPAFADALQEAGWVA